MKAAFEELRRKNCFKVQRNKVKSDATLNFELPFIVKKTSTMDVTMDDMRKMKSEVWESKSNCQKRELCHKKSIVFWPAMDSDTKWWYTDR